MTVMNAAKLYILAIFAAIEYNDGQQSMRLNRNTRCDSMNVKMTRSQCDGASTISNNIIDKRLATAMHTKHEEKAAENCFFGSCSWDLSAQVTNFNRSEGKRASKLLKLTI